MTASAAPHVVAWLCCCALALHAANIAESFSPPFHFKRSASRCDPKLHSHEDCDRRSFLKNAPSLVGLVIATPANAIESIESNPAPLAAGDYDCLLDLPPITPGCARLYLCRHGQTENNRLNLVQGARVDPPLNDNGREQARRLGLAISRLEGSNGAAPRLAVHSRLRRARETAEVLAATASSQSTAKKPTLKVVGEVASLGEVDFGGLEGMGVESFRRARRATFASWAMGNVDARLGGEGESGREVLERAASALDELGKLATTSSTPSMLAVSHSVYLRMLLAMVGDASLAETVLWKIRNGAVNVVDVNVEGRKRLVTASSGLFGGKLVGKIKGGNGLELEIPEVHLIRRNEVRHLQGMDI